MRVRPRHAASLVLTREGSGGLEVLMGRRRARAAFMPDVFVFPGGRVDLSDARARPARPLKPAVRASLAAARALNGLAAERLANAAIRETQEETGLLVGAAGDPGAAAGPDWAAFRAAGLAPDHGALTFIGRAITPASSPIRFHARFFMAAASSVHGSLVQGGELLDLAFRPVAGCLALPVIDVTELMLREAERVHAGRDHAPAILTYRAERAMVRRPVH